VAAIHATSPGNHQAWIAVSGIGSEGEARDFARRLKSGTGGQSSASGATRVAGTGNFKTKYHPNFPVVTILETHPGRTVTPEQLEGMGLVAAPEPAPAVTSFAARSQAKNGGQRDTSNKVWPDYARSLAGARPSLQGDGPDRSMADFVWCMTAIDWGWSVEDTAAKLPGVSEKAREKIQLRDKGYCLVTAQNAAAAVERKSRARS